MTKTGIYGENTALAHLRGSEGWPLVGHTFDYLLDTYRFGRELRRRFGEVYRSRAFFMRFVVLASPDGLEFVLKDTEQNFSSKLGWEPFLARLFPQSLPTMDFEEHRHHRRIMQDVFKPGAMSSYMELIDATVSQGLDGWRRHDVVKAYPAIKEIMLDVGARAFLGIELRRDMEFVNKTFVTVNKGLAPIVPFPVPGNTLWRARRARERLFAFFRPIISARKQTDGGKDVLSRLCRATDEDGAEFTEQAILYHLLTVLSASHDTSTTSLTIALHYLTRHPEWQERLRATSLALGKKSLGFSDLGALEEHEWVFREALRLYPPAPQLFRRAVRDCEFEGHKIPANTQVMADVGYVHRAEEYWKDALSFDPERFSPARSEHKQHRHKWVPFGGGAHVCIGMQFALMTARITLHHLLTRYRFEPASKRESEFVIVPITQPKDGLPLRIVPL